MGRLDTSESREALAQFADEVNAHRYLEKLLWPEGPKCPRCGSGHGKVGRLRGNSTKIGTYKCYSCRRPFSVLHGTLMRNSHVPAHKWLQAIYLTTGPGTQSASSQDLQRILNVSFKTAASIRHRLRKASASLTNGPEPM